MLAFIGAPMLFVQMLAYSYAQKLLNDPLAAFFGVLYIGGWIAGAIGLRRRRATGNGRTSKGLFITQIAVLSLALLFSVQETIGIKESIFFAITDLAYPLSHLLMLVVGVFVWRARVWRGLPRIAPLIVGCGLPSYFLLAPFLGHNLGGLVFSGLTAVGFSITARAVYKSA
jgi:hypothetical protein